MKIKKAEQDHVNARKSQFAKAHAAAVISVRASNKLCGLDKIRDPLAFQAALKATGFSVDGFVLPVSAGKPTSDIYNICAAEFDAAVDAAHSAING